MVAPAVLPLALFFKPDLQIFYTFPAYNEGENKLREGGDVMRGGLRYRTHQFTGLIHNTIESAYLSGGVLLMLLAVLVLYLALLTGKAY